MTPATLVRDEETLDIFGYHAGDTVDGGLEADEIIVDLFAGGGGASLGIEWATGRSPDEAVNHSATAIAIHKANHPTTNHHHSDIWEVDPRAVARGRKVGLLWASPDCTHHSKAKGGKPVSKKLRALAHVVVRYAKAVRPRVISLENVEEFQSWGPVSRKTNRPDPLRKGRSFRTWRRQLEREGYAVEWRLLRGCDFGAPTIRRRLFLIARCDGRPIRWPEPTHGNGRAQPWRTAAECIDWSIPCPSIFLTTEEGRELGVRRPLAEKTLRRIARGIRRYVIESADPFIIPIDHASSGAAGARSVTDPLSTITAEARHAVVAPTLVQTGYGERKGQAPRSLDIQQPLGTVVGCGQKHALVSAFLAKHYGGVVGSPMTDPVHTVTATDHNALVTASLAAPVIVEPGQRHDRGEKGGGEPLSTIVAKDRHALVSAFLMTYYSSGGQHAALDKPSPTVVANDRIALVTVRGVQYAIADIGMRMLTPRELARAQGFPDSYVLDVTYLDPKARRLKRVTKRDQVEMVGNSVNPHAACAILRANLGTRERAKVAA